jgi:hypothetical protein
MNGIDSELRLVIHFEISRVEALGSADNQFSLPAKLSRINNNSVQR